MVLVHELFGGLVLAAATVNDDHDVAFLAKNTMVKDDVVPPATSFNQGAVKTR